MTGNDGDGVKADESGAGDLEADIRNSDLADNPGGSGTDIGEDDAGQGRVIVTRCDLSGNADGPTNNDVDVEILRNNIVDPI